jgi:hypothetical protein
VGAPLEVDHIDVHVLAEPETTSARAEQPGAATVQVPDAGAKTSVGASVIDLRPQTACYLGTRGRRAQREEGDEPLGRARDMHLALAAHEAEPAE